MNDKPNIPPSAVALLVHSALKPPTMDRLFRQCRRVFGNHYKMSPSTIKKHVQYCEKRGWVAVGGPGIHAKIRPAKDSTFFDEIDIAMLQGAEVIAYRLITIPQLQRTTQ